MVAAHALCHGSSDDNPASQPGARPDARNVGPRWSNGEVPRQLTPAAAADVAAALARHRAGTAERADLRLLVKHFLALLQVRAPGASVEVRVPPYAAVQVIPGVRHTRGTPPAVVELDADTWISLAAGDLAWSTAREGTRVRASGERTDLSAYLPLADD
ncbi:MAG: hypothetical protein JWO46_589 [Nocardioidaceae bacterium]|nr:hypothetical protein [Nocardioidaceae bacterium]